MSKPEKNSPAPQANSRTPKSWTCIILHNTFIVFPHRVLSPNMKGLGWDSEIEFPFREKHLKMFYFRAGVGKRACRCITLALWELTTGDTDAFRTTEYVAEQDSRENWCQVKKLTTKQRKLASHCKQQVSFCHFVLTTAKPLVTKQSIVYNFWTWFRLRSLLWVEQEEKKTCSLNEWKLQDELLYGIQKVKYYIAKISNDLIHQV